MRISLWPYLILMILLLSQISVFAGGMGKWWKNKEIVTKLQLTSSQVDNIEKVFDLHKAKLNETKQNIIQKERELNKKYKDPKANKQEIDELADQVDLLKLQLRKIHRNMQLEIREVLSPDQRKMLYDEWSNRKHKK
ncbi:MAG: periplasmic heavy metal sensor [Candidatus Dadabacteria bacterium]|nr:periplasmic heavy metal sensor [Candidatus Dadabacteria bacterium]NIV41135.1 periplasmic heavy metal sensor [Candidatus Dadabacteria bacterium]NIX16128.1 periplasmic heavy metal sensor [Candidatus Dadabacteria bacterium]